MRFENGSNTCLLDEGVGFALREDLDMMPDANSGSSIAPGDFKA